jgi:PAS domain S-box-containing protein
MADQPTYRGLQQQLADMQKRLAAAEAARREMEAAIDASDDLIVYYNRNMTVQWANKPAADSLGRDPGDLAGLHCREIWQQRSTSGPECPVVMALETGLAQEAEMIGPDGQVWHVKGAPVYDRSGEVVAVIECCRNITGRKAAEKKLGRYKQMVTASRDFMSLIDRNFTYQIVNKTYSRAYGKQREEIEGQSIAALKGAAIFDELKAKFDRCLEGERIHFQDWFDTPGFGRVYLDTAFYPVFDEHGKAASFVVISRDITRLKRLEEELFQAQKMEAVGTLASGIAHDFNNLLMGIRGRVSLVLDDLTAAQPVREHLQHIETYVQNAADLTSQLLAFARGGKYAARPTALNQLVAEQVHMFGRTHKEITIVHDLPDALWPVEVDRGQIKQVLLNLFVNAWHAMPDGGTIRIRAENVILEDDDVRPFKRPPGRYVKISLTDSGIGIQKEVLARIFEPFFSTKEMGRGSGLGLASVYGIVENHGGIIDVHSQAGKGTTFDIHLPASDKPAVEESMPPRPRIKGTGTLLLVDDEDMILDVGRRLLLRLGYRVLTAENAQQAVGLYSRHMEEIDLVILDMIMPQIGGGEIFDQLKSINPEVKVLLASGYSADGKAAAILARGCAGFIQKPFTLDDLADRLDQILNGTPPRPNMP